MDVLTPIDLTLVEGLDSTPSLQQLEVCQQVADCLTRTGCLIVRHSAVSIEDNDRFLDMMEQYFGQSDQDKLPDARPELSFQVGLTPEQVEAPKALTDEELQDRIRSLPDGHQAIMPHSSDVKCRFMWRIGQRPSNTDFPELNAQPVIPKAFPQWQDVMDGFGSRMLAVAQAVAVAAAVGFGLAPTALLEVMEGGPHLLAPTGSDLDTHGRLNTVLAGFHSDLNMLTLHGKSRFPGLHVWLADNTKLAVKVPEGCLLVQAGQQFEWLTGGRVKAGMHEVVVTDATQAAIAAARAAGRSLWRVSSTLFTHVASDATLRPLGTLATPDNMTKYPPTLAGLQVQQELEAISLRPSATSDVSRRHSHTDTSDGPTAVDTQHVQCGSSMDSDQVADMHDTTTCTASEHAAAAAAAARGGAEVIKKGGCHEVPQAVVKAQIASQLGSGMKEACLLNGRDGRAHIKVIPSELHDHASVVL